VLVVWAAKRLRRPVKWVCDRRDAFLIDFHGRDLVSKAELALDAKGNFLALRANRNLRQAVVTIPAALSQLPISA
jgi:carbon-monoxide dehydrogenase large subunit